MNFEIKLKKIDHRNWLKIRSDWFQNLPNINPPGSPPEFELSQTIGLDKIVNEIQDTGEYKFELTGLREAIFHEGIFLLHKAIHVSGCSEINMNNGMLTWSLSNSYHSAFFAVKAILCFLGISITEIDNKMILIDVWPEPEKLSKTKLKKGLIPKTEMKSIKMPRLQHHHIWHIFQRIIRTLTISLWKKELINFLLSLNPKDFAFQRNKLHYKNNIWIHNDLHEPLTKDKFGVRLNLLCEIEEINPSTDDFSVLLSFILIKLAYAILKDIARDAPIIFEDFQIIENKFSFICYNRLKTTILEN